MNARVVVGALGLITVALAAGCGSSSGDGPTTGSSSAAGGGSGTTVASSRASAGSGGSGGGGAPAAGGGGSVGSSTASSSTSSNGGGGAGGATSASAASGSGGGSHVLHGGVEKGPFILGTSVLVSALDAAGMPTGQVYATQTTSDEGDFTVDVGSAPLVSLQGTGFYYDEITGSLSLSSITLRSTGDPTAGAIYINPITHITQMRVLSLFQGGASLTAAEAQAESELRVALGIGVDGFDPHAAGNATTLLQGDDDASAYLFAVGAVILQAAATQAGPGGPIDATFQQMLNTMASDFAPAGDLPAATKAQVAAAELALDADAAMANLGQRFQTVGVTSAVPNLHRVLDGDQDNLADIDDNCPKVYNPDQADSNMDGVGDACSCGNGVLDPGEECDDGNLIDFDGCQHDCTKTCESVADLPLTGNTPAISGFASAGSQVVFFTGPTAPNLTTLYTTNPVSLGTTSIAASIGTLNAPEPIATVGSLAFFPGQSDLWKTDGTAAGTVDLGVPMATTQVVPLASSVYFFGNPSGSAGLWRSDGTPAGTNLVTPTVGSYLLRLGARLMFLACGVTPNELIVTDGTAGGTSSFTAPNFCMSGPAPAAAQALGLAFYRVPHDPSHPPPTGPYDVWRTDGTAAGSFVVAGPLTIATYLNPDTVFGGLYYFGANQLYRTDGTASGTATFGSFTNVSVLTVLPVGVLFSGTSAGNTGLWFTDGTLANTTFLGALSSPLSPVVVGGSAFVLDYSLGYRLWVTDGTPAGTRQVVTGSTVHDNFITRVGNYIYMSATDGTHGIDPWRCRVN